MQLAAIIVSLVLIVVGVALFGRAIAQIYRFVRLGQPVPAGSRTDDPKQRTLTVAKEFLGHTRMNRWGVVGVAHWFVAVGFFSLLLTIVNAIGQLFKADWILPVIGDWAPYNVFVEFLGLMTTLGILTLIVIRQLSRPGGAGRKSRFAGSNFGQAYFVEAVILIVGVCILTLHALE
ncbi:Fe-S oxidoreductase, partial [Streptomyces sp. NPDC057654]